MAKFADIKKKVILTPDVDAGESMIPELDDALEIAGAKEQQFFDDNPTFEFIQKDVQTASEEVEGEFESFVIITIYYAE